MADEQDAGFLARWSRRKRMTEAEATATDPTIEPVEDAEAIAARDAAEAARIAEEEENRAAAEAIDLSTLGYGDDFSLFLKRGVPEALRRDALRRFFASDPLLANLDGLNDYDQDFNDPAQLIYRSIRDPVRGFVDDVVEAVRPTGEPDRPPSVTVDEIAAERPDALGHEGDSSPPREDGTAAIEAPAEAPIALEVPSEPIAAEAPVEAEPPPRRVSLRRRLEG
jgi:hypothetical protein